MDWAVGALRGGWRARGVSLCRLVIPSGACIGGETSIRSRQKRRRSWGRGNGLWQWDTAEVAARRFLFPESRNEPQPRTSFDPPNTCVRPGYSACCCLEITKSTRTVIVEVISLLRQGDAPFRSVSAKQSPSKTGRDWYPYYAGFTEDFVGNVLCEYLEDATHVLDPWSGSGTTTAVCIKKGRTSAGIDINPALTVIARGRLAPAKMKSDLIDLGTEIAHNAARAKPVPQSADLLRIWVKEDALYGLRRLQKAIHETIGVEVPNRYCPSLSLSVDLFPVLLAFFYTALFASVRGVLVGFRTTNPMWIKKPSTAKDRINPTWEVLQQSFRRCVSRLAELLSMPEPVCADEDVPFATGDATCLPYATNSFDAVVSSPPYATRLDYVNGTLPELAILGAVEQTVVNLREKVTGSPVVGHLAAIGGGESLASDYANQLLKKIRRHPSKGSRNYYFPWMANYLRHLEDAVSEIDRTVTENGSICLVVQDSRYKDLHVDLQQIVTELVGAKGRQLVQRVDHPARNLRFDEVKLRRSRGKGPKNKETLLVFRCSQR